MYIYSHMHEHTRALIHTHTLAPALCTSVEKLLSWKTENYDTTFHFVDNDLRVTSKTFCKSLMFLCLCLLQAHNKKHSPRRKKKPCDLYIYIYIYIYICVCLCVCVYVCVLNYFVQNISKCLLFSVLNFYTSETFVHN